MGKFEFKRFALNSFIRLLLFTLFATNLTAYSPLQDGICNLFCGQGSCQGVDKSPGFECKCSSGWTNLMNISSWPCVLPNCTINFQCGNGSPPPLPPPPPFSLLPNFSDPCLINLCGPDGTCETDGSSFKCQCFQGSANLFNNPKFPCFKKCSLGADCNNLDLGFNHPPPPSPPANNGSQATAPPISPPANPGSQATAPPSLPANPGSQATGDRLNGLGKLHILSMTLALATLFLK